uniref:NECAP PHear domain-containing protein n=1 Tax=Araucaria cunninghamii TaxID=56994 RepID=A0A0D6R9R8_ARACU
MAKDDQSAPEAQPGEEEEAEIAELMLFQTKECYVYMIPPRKSAASYRADEWNVNKWAWEGALRVISKGEECRIKLEDKNTGELYAQAFVRRGQPLPVEPVIDSSRYFALCIEENFGGRMRHAFIGIGFRERPVAYDFQAALYDHVKYLNKKQAAEEMEQQYQTSSSVNYSLKEGQTLKLQLKNPHKGAGTRRSIFFEQELDNISLDESGEKKHPLPSLALPPPPPAPSSPSSPSASYIRSQKNMMSENLSFPSSATQPKSTISSTIDAGEKEGLATKDGDKGQDSFEDDFGDFQTAG